MKTIQQYLSKFTEFDEYLSRLFLVKDRGMSSLEYALKEGNPSKHLFNVPEKFQKRALEIATKHRLLRNHLVHPITTLNNSDAIPPSKFLENDNNLDLNDGAADAIPVVLYNELIDFMTFVENNSAAIKECYAETQVVKQKSKLFSSPKSHIHKSIVSKPIKTSNQDSLAALDNNDLKKMLEYQKEDLKLIKIERDARPLVDKANQLKAEFATAKAKFEKLFSEREELSLSSRDADKEKLSAVEKQLFDIQQLAANIKDSYNEIKLEIESASKETQPIIEKLRAMESKLSPALLSRYQKLRKSQVSPIFVPLQGSSCSGCGLSIANEQLKELAKAGDTIVCESCKRIIYKD